MITEVAVIIMIITLTIKMITITIIITVAVYCDLKVLSIYFIKFFVTAASSLTWCYLCC